MTALSTKAVTDFGKMLTIDGQKVRFRYFTIAYPNSGSGYDDTTTLTTSGSDLWVSGVVQPVTGPKGNDEAALWEQGRIIFGDNRLYVPGNVSTSGLWKAWIGSPVVREYAVTDAGQNAWNIQGAKIYTKVFVRYLPTGSLAGE